MWRSFAGSHLDTSISIRDTPRYVTGAARHSKSAAYGRTRDGRRNYVHFVTAYDIHFIVNNKYYAMKLQEKSETCLYFPRNFLHSEPLSRLPDLLSTGLSTGLSIYLFITLVVDILADLWL